MTRRRHDDRVSLAAPHGARLLALHLLPAPGPETERRPLVPGVRSTRSAATPRAPRSTACAPSWRSTARRAALRAFSAYWKAQLDLLAEAEQWHRAAGWDWYSVQTRSSMFTRYKLALSRLDALVEHPDGATFPLRDRGRCGCGRGCSTGSGSSST
jgi:hypothetical protein